MSDVISTVFIVPEFLVAGQLSSVHVLIDPFQLALIKDLLDYNLGEPLEEFERPESVIRDPIIPVCIQIKCVYANEILRIPHYL